MTINRLPKIVYLEKLVSVLGLNESSLDINIEETIQHSKERHLPLYFSNKVTGVPLETELTTVGTGFNNGEIIDEFFIPYGTEREIFNDDKYKSINSAKVFTCPDTQTVRVAVSEFTCEEEHYMYMPDKLNIHEPLMLELKDIFCERDDVIAFMNTEVNLPSYLDRDSDCYSQELDLAIQLHHAIYIDKYKYLNKNTESKVSYWLNQHKPDLDASAAMIERLARVISINNK